MSRFIAALAVTAAIGVAVSLDAQEATFRSGVDLVTVDATVLASDGTPIDHLGPDDFRLEVDGRPRRVVSAQFVSQTAQRGVALRRSAVHYTSNEGVDAGRLVVVAVDEPHIRRVEGRSALRAAETFVDSLDPADRIGVVGLTRLGRLDFSRDRFELKQRLHTLMGQGDPVFLQFNLGLSEALDIAEGSRTRLADAVLRECGRALTEFVNQARAVDDAAGRDPCPEHVEQEARGVAQNANTQARISIASLEALIVGLKDIPGPKTVVLLSEGIIADPRRIDLLKLAAEAQASRVTIYALQLEVPVFEAAQDRVSPTAIRDLQMLGDGLARVAGAARGTVFRLVGDDPKPFQRISRELSGYYLLAFEPTDGERDGQRHRIQLALARGGGELRARTGFTLPAATPSVEVRNNGLTALLRNLSLSTELPVRVATYVYAEPASSNLRIVVSAEAEASGGASTALGFVLIDGRGVIAATEVRDAASGRHAFSAVVPAGPYILRVGAIDPLGRQGSVERIFDGRLLEVEGVRLSDLILAPAPSRPADPLQPLIDRVTSSPVVAYLEMHAADAAQLPDAVRILVSREGDASSVMTIDADVNRPRGDVRSIDAGAQLAIARATIPAVKLRPGAYVARAEVSMNGRALARVSRPFTIPER